jgi:hypothetical protein
MFYLLDSHERKNPRLITIPAFEQIKDYMELKI